MNVIGQRIDGGSMGILVSELYLRWDSYNQHLRYLSSSEHDRWPTYDIIWPYFAEDNDEPGVSWGEVDGEVWGSITNWAVFKTSVTTKYIGDYDYKKINRGIPIYQAVWNGRGILNIAQLNAMAWDGFPSHGGR